MAEWKKVPLEQDGALAWTVEVEGRSAPLRVMGAEVTVLIEGGPVNVLGSLTPGGTASALNDLQHLPMTQRRDGLEGIAEKVYALTVTGRGTVTVFAVRR